MLFFSAPKSFSNSGECLLCKLNIYIIKDWYLDNNIWAQQFDNKIPAKDITVFAKWGTNTVTITFDSKDKKGQQRKRVSVQANTYPAETVLWFTANVEEP